MPPMQQTLCLNLILRAKSFSYGICPVYGPIKRTMANPKVSSIIPIELQITQLAVHIIHKSQSTIHNQNSLFVYYVC